jgi:transcriptional regulator with XRE-family HTH domain
MRKTLRSPSQKLFLGLLKEARKEAGLTQAVVAKKLRKPQSFVAKYEHGERRIDVVEFVAIARVLQTDPIDLLRKFLDKDEDVALAGPKKPGKFRRGGT